MTGALAAALVSGLSGFAFALVAAAAWLHILPPLQTTTLIFACSILTNSLAMWRLRDAINLTRLWPFLLGSTLGVPLGAELLRGAEPDMFRAGVGIFLVLFCLYSLWRPKLRVAGGGRTADAALALLSGALGGATGLSGILLIVWSNLRGWTKDVQRAVFAPVVMATNCVAVIWLGGRGAIDAATIWLFALAGPAVVLGTWAGLKLYGRLDEAGFRRVVLGLLMLSGIVLLV